MFKGKDSPGGMMDDVELALFERGVEALEKIAEHLGFIRLYSGGGGRIDPRPWTGGGGGGGGSDKISGMNSLPGGGSTTYGSGGGGGS